MEDLGEKIERDYRKTDEVVIKCKRTMFTLAMYSGSKGWVVRVPQWDEFIKDHAQKEKCCGAFLQRSLE